MSFKNFILDLGDVNPVVISGYHWTQNVNDGNKGKNKKFLRWNLFGVLKFIFWFSLHYKSYMLFKWTFCL